MKNLLLLPLSVLALTISATQVSQETQPAAQPSYTPEEQAVKASGYELYGLLQNPVSFVGRSEVLKKHFDKVARGLDGENNAPWVSCMYASHVAMIPADMKDHGLKEAFLNRFRKRTDSIFHGQFEGFLTPEEKDVLDLTMLAHKKAERVSLKSEAALGIMTRMHAVIESKLASATAQAQAHRSIENLVELPKGYFFCIGEYVGCVQTVQQLQESAYFSTRQQLVHVTEHMYSHEPEFFKENLAELKKAAEQGHEGPQKLLIKILMDGLLMQKDPALLDKLKAQKK